MNLLKEWKTNWYVVLYLFSDDMNEYYQMYCMDDMFDLLFIIPQP